MATRAQGQNGPSQRKISQLVLLGDSAVAKSILVLRLVKGQLQQLRKDNVVILLAGNNADLAISRVVDYQVSKRDIYNKICISHKNA